METACLWNPGRGCLHFRFSIRNHFLSGSDYSLPQAVRTHRCQRARQPYCSPALKEITHFSQLFITGDRVQHFHSLLVFTHTGLASRELCPLLPRFCCKTWAFSKLKTGVTSPPPRPQLSEHPTLTAAFCSILRALMSGGSDEACHNIGMSYISLPATAFLSPEACKAAT